ncbi:MAG: NADH-quinone oxidoreductase subunit J [Coriobacteriales bacterium]|nr:NADH-quinone oxidoreductase subunit J [Coriobacteriales bacterium]
MPNTVDGIAFAILAISMVGGALGMVSSRNIVHAALWLLEVSVAAAGLYYLLDADFIALVQLLVYAGAVVVLTVFTVMITLRRREDAVRPVDFSWPALLLALALGGILLAAAANFPKKTISMPDAMPSIVRFGELLFTARGYALAFEIASVLLTVALLAAVWWSREVED